MLPTREQAEAILKEAESCNPGPWGNHSRCAAHCAEKIASLCPDMDSEKAYIVGLLHDIGKFDTSEEELQLIQNTLKTITMDEYDKLIQLCDSLAGAEGVLDIEERMGDVKRRYGGYPEEKWNKNLALKKYFEEKTGMDIYVVTQKDTFRL